MTSNLGSLKIRECWKNLKIDWEHSLVSSLAFINECSELAQRWTPEFPILVQRYLIF